MSKAIPGRPGAPRPAIAPNQTLYVTRLPSAKITKNDLRRELYMLFSTYGPVLDIVALRTAKMRGQAHITYRDIQTASMAMRELQGFDFYGNELEIQYSKSKSDTIAKLDGTFRMASAAAGAVTSTELQQSIFNAPPSAAIASLPPKPVSSLKPPAPSGDHAMEGLSPTNSVAGQKRRRDEDDDGEKEEEEDDDSDVAMEEDSDDD